MPTAPGLYTVRLYSNGALLASSAVITVAAPVNATLTAPKHRVNVNTLEQQPAAQLELNEIGVCHLTVDSPVGGPTTITAELPCES